MQVVVLALSLIVLVSKVSTAPRTDLLAHLLQNEADGKKVRIICDFTFIFICNADLFCYVNLQLFRPIETFSFICKF